MALRDEYNFEYGTDKKVDGIMVNDKCKALAKKIIRHKHDPAHIKDDEAKWDVVPTKIEMNEILSIDVTPQEQQDLSGKGGDE